MNKEKCVDCGKKTCIYMGEGCVHTEKEKWKKGIYSSSAKKGVAMEKVKKESLCFSISGEFVTNMARDWLYAERRPYEKVLEFLLSCMCGTNLDGKTLKNYADDVLAGKRKFIGNTKNDSYCMVFDNTNILEKYPLFFKRKYCKRKKTAMFIDPYASIKAQKKAAKALNLDRTIMNLTKQKREEIPILENYGWLSPDGIFFEAEWGSHSSWASCYIDEHFPDVSTAPFDEGYYSGDFLIKRGWLLLHNPYNPRGIADISDVDICNATEKQKEFLYDYYFSRDMPIKAKSIYKESA